MEKDLKKWLEGQIEIYTREKPYYTIYADTLEDILKAACRIYAPLAIVTKRVKGNASFLQKAIKKRQKYDDPVSQFTDFCGVRVITETKAEVELICDFIRKNFIIDEENSVDVLERLKPTEFGYRSIHYIVQVKGSSLLDVKIPKEIGERKAEIQVRTLLEHAWASVYHDRFYKGDFEAPKQWERQLARVMALLEIGDDEFSRLLEDYARLRLNYNAYLTLENVENRISVLSIAMEKEKNRNIKRSMALDIASIAKVVGLWEKAVDSLDDFTADKCHERPLILMEHGFALYQSNKQKPNSTPYKQGQKEIEIASKEADGFTQAQAFSYLAMTYKNLPKQNLKVREFYKRAHEINPENPYFLLEYIASEISCDSKFPIAQIEYKIINALNLCRDHIDAGIELPSAFYAIAKFNLLLGKMYDSLRAYTKAINICLSSNACIQKDIFDAEIAFLKQINPDRELPLEHKWVADILLIAKYLKFNEKGDLAEIRKRSSKEGISAEPMVVVVGAADKMEHHQIAQYEKFMKKAFDGFRGTIISGGTTSGVSGIVGSLSDYLNAKKNRSLDVRGYLPAKIPSNSKKDTRYKSFIVTEGDDFSPGQQIQCWLDIIASGMTPSDVKVIGIGGGELAEFELCFALSIGAIVGVVSSSGGTVKAIIDDADWEGIPNLHALPSDMMVLRAFISPTIVTIDKESIDKIAKGVHEKYIAENRHRSRDPSMLPWELLDRSLVESNRHQVIYSGEILKQAGYGIRKAKGKPKIVKFTKSEIELMAEMEHGRWVIERLKSGWRYCDEYSLERKTSPYLISWSELSEVIRDYDRRAIQNWPELFASTGYEIYSLDK